MPYVFTEEQLQFLNECPADISRDEISEITGIPIDELPEKPKKTRRTNGKPHQWTPEQDAFLRENHGKMPNKELIELLGIKPKAVMNRWINHIGNGTPWGVNDTILYADEEETVAYLKENIGVIPWTEMAKITGKSERTLTTLAKRHGIYKSKEELSEKMPLDDTLAFLREHIHDMTWKEMSAKTDRTIQVLHKLATRHGIRKNTVPQTKLTEEQKQYALSFLTENINQMTWQQMSKGTNIPESTLQSLAKTHHIRKAPVTDVYRGVDKTKILPFLQTHIQSMTWQQLADETGLSKDQLQLLAKQNGICKTDNSIRNLPPEKEQEIQQFLQEHIDTLSWREIAEHIGYTQKQAQDLAKRYGIQKTTKYTPRTVTETEEQEIAIFLKEKCDKLTWSQMREHTGLSKNQLLAIMEKNGIQKQNTRAFKEQQEKTLLPFLRENIDKMSWKELCAATGKSQASLYAYAAKRGIYKQNTT